MAFADPQVVTVDGNNVTLPRVSVGPRSGAFSLPTEELKLSVSHTLNKRARRQIRLDSQKIVPDPMFPATNVPRSMSVYLVVDAPLTGFTITEQHNLLAALAGYLQASSGAKAIQFLGGES